MSKKLTRRNFLKGTAAAAVASQLKKPFHSHNPRYTLAASKLNVAAIGAGGKGYSDINHCSDENIVALADVDSKRAAQAFAEFDKASKYADFRDMLDKHPEIDAVTISTPDHFHAYAADYAMRLGKHVYVQKPLAHTVFEARQMRVLSKKHGVVTQMGNQGHNGSGYLTLVQLIRSGVIGKIKEAHAWSNRPIWPQGVERPKGSDPVPKHLHWDLWLGVAKQRPFVGPQPGSKRNRGVYHPFNWRGWMDFGVGALGDMGCHIIDPIVWSCGLGSPTAVRSTGPEPNGETFPKIGRAHV